MLNLYRQALHLRRSRPELGDGTLEWLDAPAGVLHLQRGSSFSCLVNVDAGPVAIPEGASPILASEPLTDETLPAGAAVWMGHD